MSNRALIVQELEVTVSNKPGKIAEISNIVSAAGVNIVALRAYCIGNAGFIHFVTDNNTLACEILEKKNYKVKHQDVVMAALKNEIGAVYEITEQLSSKSIDLYAAYLTTGSGGDTTMVIAGKDLAAIVEVLNAE